MVCPCLKTDSHNTQPVLPLVLGLKLNSSASVHSKLLCLVWEQHSVKGFRNMGEKSISLILKVSHPKGIQ